MKQYSYLQIIIMVYRICNLWLYCQFGDINRKYELLAKLLHIHCFPKKSILRFMPIVQANFLFITSCYR